MTEPPAMPEITSQPEVSDVINETDSSLVASASEPRINGCENNNSSDGPAIPTIQTPDMALPNKPKLGSLFDNPKLKNIVFQAMEKDREEKLSIVLPKRRQSGPGSLDSPEIRTSLFPEDPTHARPRRMSDFGCRRVRRPSAAVSFRRLSLNHALHEMEEDPLEWLLESCGTPVTSESRGAYRRFSSILNQTHVTGLCSGFTLGVSAALVFKSALILLVLLWSFTPG